MAQKDNFLGLRLNKDRDDTIDEIEDDFQADRSEVARRLLDRGMEYYGYKSTDKDTFLHTLTNELGRGFLYIATAFVIVTFLTAGTMWIWALLFAVFGFLISAVAIAEPRITHAYRRRFR